MNVKLAIQRFDLYELLFKRLPQLYRRQDAILHIIVLILLIGGTVTRFFNAYTHHFTVLDFSTVFATSIPGTFIIWFIGVLLTPKYTRTGLFLSSLSQSFLFTIVVVYALSGALTTPFPTIDLYLLHFDRAIGFSTLQLMAFTHHHTLMYHCLRFAYDTWFFQLALTPVFLAFFKARNEIDRYLIATFFSMFIGGLIFYFWPTVAPAGILQSHYFTMDQHDLVTRFNEIHQGLPITTFDGGTIAFPSFHVINCLLALYAWRRYTWVFIPLLIVNILSIFATMALGYHYVTDVLAGFLIAYLSILFTQCLLMKCIKNRYTLYE